MKLDQIAIYATDNEARMSIKRLFGLQDAQWIRDAAVGHALARGRRYQNVIANLEFNYDLGIEFEILSFTSSSPYWQRDRNRASFFSHLGFHVDEWPVLPDTELVFELWTEGHSNPFLRDLKRTYEYRIYNTVPTLGVYSKFIRRVEAPPET